jgi:hypothetical protein
MLGKLLDSFVENIGLAALLISSGLLILISNRDLFEVDPKPREELDPTGTIQKKWMWKYLSDHAQRARLELLHLIRLLRVGAGILLGAAVVLFFVAGIVGMVDWLGYKNFSAWWQGNPAVDLVFDHGIGLIILAIGPFLVFRLARVVSNVVRARDVPAANKPPGWTPY